MYQIILIYLLIHNVCCFINHGLNQEIDRKNLQVLLLDSPVIKTKLIDVTEQTDRNLINKFIKEYNFLPKAINNSLLNDLNVQNAQLNRFKVKESNQLFKFDNETNQTDQRKHFIFKRENNADNEPSLDDELERIKTEFEPFMLTRSPQNGDVTNKAIIREYIIAKFNNLRMKTYKQTFMSSSPHSNFRKGMNIFSIFPSQLRIKALNENRRILNDQILVLGAHYDTVNNSPGIDDNASGVVNLLELARLLHANKVSLNYTIYFVAFDFEELGLHGSKAFVDKFLIPTEIIERKSDFLGAFITDMLLNYNNEENTQTLPADIRSKVPKLNKISEDNHYRGNYIAMWSRRNIDKDLATKLIEVWSKSEDSGRFKLINMNPRLPVTIKSRSTADLGTFIRSDHANFWYPKVRNFDRTLNAVLLTDLGPWRSTTNVCYHKACDDEKQLTKTNLEFFLHTNKMLYKVLTENPPVLNSSNNNLLRGQFFNSPNSRKPMSKRIPRFRTLFLIENSNSTLNQ